MPSETYLTPEQVASFKNDGYVALKGSEVFDAKSLASLEKWVTDVQNWEEKPGGYMQYYEKSSKDGSRILCRTENFLDAHPEMKELFTGRIEDMVSELLGEESILYKEKINFKLPGGDGFKPHQDHAAGWWMYGQTFHISMLIAIDDCTVENGCLQVVAGEHTKGLLGPEHEEVPDELVKKFKWTPVPGKLGDVVFFDSFVPHRSEPNTTQEGRRILYLTYAKKSEGDFREKYYADKRISFPPDIERDPSKTYAYKI
eukprot:TRINITY_DN303_c0_g1_i2.p1 TRINITY_DN303_c0_g1~~TRINITY_DN303_c0_g1_i2.p1  ORF type:complete len:268 (+),score=75.79 TRINITY_DN303_c0_g1_i2:34-804(+)